MIRILFGHCFAAFWCCSLLIVELINYYVVVLNGGNFMVIILVILHVLENHAPWCTDFGSVLVCYGLKVWIQERVAGSR